METLVSLDGPESTACYRCDSKCRKPDGGPCCSASRLISGRLLQVHADSLGNQLCPCLMDYGGDQFCRCPTRIKTFKLSGT